MEGGQGVVGQLSWLVQDDTVCVFESGGVVSKGDQWRKEVEEEVGADGFYLLPDRVR